jgi:UDP-N-acetylmuramyl pentapeptide phosphotransferase/UDP-N-acetylglucosamine-1-phosphate transferase
MILLGFTDDVLDLRWSVKITLSAVATLPLLVGYEGATNIIVPLPMRAFLGYSVQLSEEQSCLFVRSRSTDLVAKALRIISTCC